MLLFFGLLIQVERSDNIQSLFVYELAPIPTALFKDDMMRKRKESTLAPVLKDGVAPEDLSELTDAKSVIEGGMEAHYYVSIGEHLPHTGSCKSL